MHDPHDRLFRRVFSDVKHAEAADRIHHAALDDLDRWLARILEAKTLAEVASD